MNADWTSFLQGRSGADLSSSHSSPILLLADRSERTVMSRRTPLIVLGAVLLAFAAFVVLVGVVLTAAFGSGRALATGPHPVATSTRALVFPVAEINGLSQVPSLLGQARIEVEATKRTGDAGVFTAVGPAADVERYLAGADVDLVTDVEALPFRLTTSHRPGTATLPAPVLRTSGSRMPRPGRAPPDSPGRFRTGTTESCS
jgi:hypothetical protein